MFCQLMIKFQFLISIFGRKYFLFLVRCALSSLDKTKRKVYLLLENMDQLNNLKNGCFFPLMLSIDTCFSLLYIIGFSLVDQVITGT